MVAINTQPITKVQQVQGDFEEAAEADTVAEEAEALALTVTDATNPVDWTYDSEAVDNSGDIHTRRQSIEIVGVMASDDNRTDQDLTVRYDTRLNIDVMRELHLPGL